MIGDLQHAPFKITESMSPILACRCYHSCLLFEGIYIVQCSSRLFGSSERAGEIATERQGENGSRAPRRIPGERGRHPRDTTSAQLQRIAESRKHAR